LTTKDSKKKNINSNLIDCFVGAYDLGFNISLSKVGIESKQLNVFGAILLD
jgi:hypothetical protein